MFGNEEIIYWPKENTDSLTRGEQGLFLYQKVISGNGNTIYSFIWWYKYFEMCHLSILFLFSEVNRVRCNYSNCFSLKSLYDKCYRKKSLLVKVIMYVEWEECISKKRFLLKRDIFGLISVAFFFFPSHILAFI